MIESILTVKEVAERYGVNTHTVLAWIRTGELRAVNCGRKVSGKKPRWRVTPEALQSFEMLRTPVPPPQRMTRRKRTETRPGFY